MSCVKRNAFIVHFVDDYQNIAQNQNLGHLRRCETTIDSMPMSKGEKMEKTVLVKNPTGSGWTHFTISSSSSVQRNGRCLYENGKCVDDIYDFYAHPSAYKIKVFRWWRYAKMKFGCDELMRIWGNCHKFSLAFKMMYDGDEYIAYITADNNHLIKL